MQLTAQPICATAKVAGAAQPLTAAQTRRLAPPLMGHPVFFTGRTRRGVPACLRYDAFSQPAGSVETGNLCEPYWHRYTDTCCGSEAKSPAMA